MFALCIPTIDRFDTFLDKNLQLYLKNPLINEIIIQDENGNDYSKLVNKYHNEPKIKLFKNPQKLGPFLNKLECCKKSSNNWIALIDSDNFAGIDYFEHAQEFINNNNLSNNTVLMPSFAKPKFDYRNLPKQITHNCPKEYSNNLITCMNTGNYIISKDLIDSIDLSKEVENIQYSSSCDVILFNTMLFEQFPDVIFYILEDLHYDHTVHNGSIYLNTYQKYQDFNNSIYARFLNIFKK